MNRTLSSAVLIVGVLLVGFGIKASQSATSSISRLFTGEPTHEAMVLLVGGAAAIIVGLGGLQRGSRG
jgi:hypothetical protein